MAAESRRQDPAVIADLLAEPRAFEFFQALRVMQFAARSVRAVANDAASNNGDMQLGFRVNNSTEFPPAAIERLELAGNTNCPEAILNCIGLTGPLGVLPRRFTTRLIELERRDSPALSAFQDLINARVTQLFYDAWEKNHFPIAFEAFRRLGRRGTAETFYRALLSCVGLGMPALQERQDVPDEAIVYFSGHFSRSPRNPDALQATLRELLAIDTTIEPFIGRWLRVPGAQQTELNAAAAEFESASRLGLNTVVGDEFWDIQSKFRVRVASLTYERYLEFLPGRRPLQHLAELTRLYCGPDFEFEVQLMICKEDVPELMMSESAAPRLGWTTILVSRPPDQDVAGAVFEFSEIEMAERLAATA